MSALVAVDKNGTIQTSSEGFIQQTIINICAAGAAKDVHDKVCVKVPIILPLQVAQYIGQYIVR